MITATLTSLLLLAAADEPAPTTPETPTTETPAPTETPTMTKTPATTETASTPAPTPPTPTSPTPASPTPASPTPASPTPTTWVFAAGPLSVTPRAQVRVRGEFVGDRTLNGGDITLGDPNKGVFVERSRIGASLALDPMVVLVELQDARVWGSEKVPVGAPNDPTIFGQNIGSLDVHQAFIALHLGDIEARLGRQEITLSNERVVGLADFGNFGRVFDAVRVFTPQGEATTWSAFGAIVQDRDAGSDDDVVVGAVSAEHTVAPWLRLSPLALFEADITAATERATLGTRVDGTAGIFGYDVDGWLQPARAADGEVRVGGLVGGRVTATFDTFLHPRVGVLTDAFTGTDDVTGANGALPFQSAFGTNHKFYGFQDLFTNLPLHTKNQGLIDSAATLWLKEGDFTAGAWVHAFFPFATAADVAVFGVEPDVNASWRVTKNLAVEVGGALFVPVGTALGRGDQVAPWGYAQVNATL